MFWDRIAGVYDIYVNVINRKTKCWNARAVQEC